MISQWKYTIDLVKETSKLGVKPFDTSRFEMVNCCMTQGLINGRAYQWLVGKLIHVTDPIHAISVVSLFMHALCTKYECSPLDCEIVTGFSRSWYFMTWSHECKSFYRYKLGKVKIRMNVYF